MSLFDRLGVSVLVLALAACSSAAPRSAPRPLAPRRPSRLCAGAHHTCVVTADARLACFGDGRAGERGVPPEQAEAVPNVVPGLEGVVEVACGWAHTCARLSSGEVHCFGGNAHGQLGHSTPGAFAFEAAQQVEGLEGAEQLAAGVAHTCARRADGSVWCWGAGRRGQLGDDLSTTRSTPAPVPRVERAVEVVAGGHRACALDAAGHVLCWGALGEHRAGGRVRLATHPVLARFLDGVRALALGAHHACAIEEDGLVRCWGASRHGLLGDAAAPALGAEARVIGAVRDAREVVTGSAHTCVRTRDRRVMCWGDPGALGELSVDQVRIEQRVPPSIVRVDSVVELAAGARHTCALRVAGDVACWGRNELGESGQATGEEVRMPLRVEGVRAAALE